MWAGGWRARLLLQRLSQVLYLDFDASHTFCVPEDPASLFIDGLAGNSSSTREEILKIPGWPRFLCESRLLECDCLLRASQQARLPLKELHLWNLPCLPNCLDERYLALHHHWHIDDFDEKLRETLLGYGTVSSKNHCRSDPVQTLGERTGQHRLFLPRPVVRGHGQSAPGALTNALLWEQSHSNNKLIHEVPESQKIRQYPAAYQIPRGIPERMRGFWVGALSPWCHCPLESGGTLPLQ